LGSEKEEGMGFGLSLQIFRAEIGFLMVLEDIAIFTTEILMILLILKV
jgi:hypothetical protein